MTTLPRSAGPQLEDDDDTVREALNEIDRQVSDKYAAAAAPQGAQTALPTALTSLPPPAAFAPPPAAFALPHGVPAYATPPPQYVYSEKAMPPMPYAVAPPAPPSPPAAPATMAYYPVHHPTPVGSLISFFGDEARMVVIVACVVILASSPAVDGALRRAIGYAADSAAGPLIMLSAKVACAVVLSYLIRWAWAKVQRGLAGAVWGT